MGRFKEEVDYAEILRREGIELPAMVEDSSADEEEITEEELNIEEIQEDTPVQANATVANDSSTQADADEREHTQTDARGRTQTLTQTRADIDAEETQTETRKETQKKTVLQRSSMLPDPIVNTKIEPLPVVIKPQHTKRGMGGSAELVGRVDVAEAKEVVKETLTGGQHHDPKVVQLPGEGRGRVVLNKIGGYNI